eukprot:6567954-Pyramimonas_sp.AAC.1
MVRWQEAPCARIIGVLLETRPDMISKPSLIKLRWLGCTRVQLGVQHTDNAILKLNERGCAPGIFSPTTCDWLTL